MKQHRLWFMDLPIVLLTSCSPTVAVTTQPLTAERMQNPTVLQTPTLTRMPATITRVQLTLTSTVTLTVLPTPAGYLQTACEERGMGGLCRAGCRIDPKGHPIIVVTWPENFDPYFAVHPCPDNMLVPSPFHPAGQ